MRAFRVFKFAAKSAKKSPIFLTASATATAVVAGVTLSSQNPSFLPFSDGDPVLSPSSIASGFEGLVRSSRTVFTVGLAVIDYKYSLWNVASDSDEYMRKLSAVHLRTAKRMLRLCEANKGFYVKAGQFISSMRRIPKEYSVTLSSLQDQAIPFHFEAIKKVIINNLHKDFSELFLSFDEQPVAAASIAQVHRALLKDKQEVAIKVQYPGLEQRMKIDITTMSILSNFISWVFPDYRFDWAVLEFEKTISMELDFVQEAKNSERTAKNFEKKKFIRVPRVYWDLTTKQVLTMQFCDGHKVDDVEYLKEIGINPAKVAKALVELFAEMIFVHGFLHGDPHPGNILVSAEGHRGFSLVLLDHGIYKELDNGFRLDYCQLWKSLILLDSHKIQDLGEKFGVGKYSRYFPVIFMGRTIDSKSAIGREMSLEEKSKLKHELKLLKMDDISSFMESLPTDFLAILRADGHLRSIISKLGAPQHVRLLSYAKYAVYGLTVEPNTQSGFFTKYTHINFKSSVNYLHLRAFLEIMELLLRIEDLGHSLAKKWRRIIFNVILFCKGRLFALTL